MPPKRGESKQGLVITLVFFVLATIGFAVGTYYGFAEQDRLAKDAKKAKDEEKTAKDSRDWWKFQALAYRGYMGNLPATSAEEAAVLRDKFMGGSAGGSKEPDEADVKTLFQNVLDKKLGWNTAMKKPSTTYEDLLAKREQRIQDLEKTNAGLQLANKKLGDQVKEQDDQLREIGLAYDKKFNDLSTKLTKDQAGNRKTINDLQAFVNTVKDQNDQLKKQFQAEQTKSSRQIKKLNDQVKDQREVLDRKEAEVAQINQKGADAPQNWRTDWKILSMDRRGDMPYINLGSADQVQPQLTFSVHGIGADGKPVPAGKATIEVARVLGPHMAQARVTSVKDANRDPILPGDVLYNPTWNPTLKKHVAIAGIIDLTGDGRDSLPEFMRTLERQNVVVDAYLDPKDLSVKGRGLSVQTDYLIVGSGLEFLTDSRDKNAEYLKKLEKGITDMRKEAERNGVRVIGLGKYLDLIGYRLPHGTSLREPESNYGRSPTGNGEREGR